MVNLNLVISNDDSDFIKYPLTERMFFNFKLIQELENEKDLTRILCKPAVFVPEVLNTGLNLSDLFNDDFLSLSILLWGKKDFYAISTFRCFDYELFDDVKKFWGFDYSQSMFVFSCFYLDQFKKDFNDEESYLKGGKENLRKKAMINRNQTLIQRINSLKSFPDIFN